MIKNCPFCGSELLFIESGKRAVCRACGFESGMCVSHEKLNHVLYRMADAMEDETFDAVCKQLNEAKIELALTQLENNSYRIRIRQLAQCLVMEVIALLSEGIQPEPESLRLVSEYTGLNEATMTPGDLEEWLECE